MVGDATFAVRPIMGYFEETSIWPGEPFVRSVAVYLIFATTLDLLAWRFLSAARRHVLLRLVFISAVGAALTLVAGEIRSLLIFLVVLAFGVVALGRFTWPIAAIGAVVVLWPLFVRPAPPDPPEIAAIPSPRPPDLVAIVLDTVRTERTSAYGHTRDTTPHLRELSARGVRFDRAYGTGSWSLPNHASLFTGLTTERHGAHDAHNYLDAEHPTLAALLAEQVEHDRALARVDVQMEGGDMVIGGAHERAFATQRMAVWRFDEHNLRASVGAEASRKRGGRGLAEFDYT